MGLKRMLLRAKIVNCLAGILIALFLSALILLNFHLYAGASHRQDLSVVGGVAKVAEVQETKRRSRRATSDSWSIPSDTYPVTLGVPWGCTQASILSEFPNATCFSYCTASSCATNDVASIQSGNSELVCTAKIMQLGFKQSGTHVISKWIKQHPRVTTKFADIFLNSQRSVEFEVCPDEQLRDSTAAAYFNPYALSSIGSSQMNYYLHCDNCLTTVYLDLYFGSLFVDLPTAMIPFIESSNQKYIITMKNPTDRAIAEYFYPYIQAGTDLNDVGGQTLHDAMSAAIDQVQACMTEHGPTACVYGYTTLSSAEVLAEAQMLYESCYYTHLYYVIQQINADQVYFMKFEEYQADPIGKIQDLYTFLGIDYLGPVELPTGAHVNKPILTETITMMDAFFSPFNTQLANLLGDTKWQYTRS